MPPDAGVGPAARRASVHDAELRIGRVRRAVGDAQGPSNCTPARGSAAQVLAEDALLAYLLEAEAAEDGT
jgi:hypothetical protein